MKQQTQIQNMPSEVFSVNYFQGVDYSHAPSNIAKSRTCDGINMVRSEVGKVCKRTGYEFDAKTYPGKINGIHFLQLKTELKALVHAGNCFYVAEQCIYMHAIDDFSHSVQVGEKLYILDGEHFLLFDGNSISQVREHAYIPTTYVEKKPLGQGKKNQQGNIFTPYRKEGFISDGTSTAYKLACEFLDNETVKVELFANGAFTPITDFSVDTINGWVYFNQPPVISASGKDNVFITYSKQASTAPDMLEKCKAIKVFGKSGQQDTIFIGGNPDYPNQDWYSVPGYTCYFGEENIGELGLDVGDVIGYSVKNDLIFAHKKAKEGTVSLVARKAQEENKMFISYPVISTLEGPSTIAANSLATLYNEPLFLTDSGIYGINKQEATQEQYTQLRSLFINPSLLKEQYLGNACGVIFKDFYVLLAGQNLYLLDGLQKNVEKDGSYSQYQYECYHWKFCGARILFVENDRLCFGTEEGRIGRFYRDYSDPNSFQDDGQAIYCCWQIPDFYGPGITQYKNLNSIWVITASAVRTGVQACIQKEGLMKPLFEDIRTARYFKWSKIDWANFTWSCDKTPKLISRKIRANQCEKLALKVENGRLKEPLGIYEIGFQYTQTSNTR